MTAIVTSTLLGMGMSGNVYAATNLQDASAPTMAGPAAVDMQQLDQRVAQLPQLNGLKDGDKVTISDDSSVTGATWSGTYTYHPAGSTFTPGALYARWKDGLVAITPTPPSAGSITWPGTYDASFIKQRIDVTGAWTINYQTIRTLVMDGNDTSVLRIPDNAWLFRVNSNGQWTALVSVFVFNSGSQPLYPNADGVSAPVASGSQPVPVAAGFWQPQ